MKRSARAFELCFGGLDIRRMFPNGFLESIPRFDHFLVPRLFSIQPEVSNQACDEYGGAETPNITVFRIG
jgi:hypothetical protein